jgi:hypothetical protein
MQWEPARCCICEVLFSAPSPLPIQISATVEAMQGSVSVPLWCLEKITQMQYVYGTPTISRFTCLVVGW